jgi:ABC-three component (ABC-3C) system Middle Component 6
MSLLLPGKQTPASESLLRQAELLYASIPGRAPVAQAWLRARELVTNVSFSRFVLMLDVLFAIGAVQINEGVLIKRSPDAA